MSPLSFAHRNPGRSRRAMLETLIRHLDMVRLTLAVVLAATVLSGCVGIIGDDPDDGLTVNQRKARDLFASKAYPILTASCSSCHASLANADFLRGNNALEVYTTIKGFEPALINYLSSEKSRIVTKAEHNGPAFAPTAKMGQTDSDYEIMLDWLRAEQRAGGDGGGDGSNGPTFILTPKITPKVCTGLRQTCIDSGLLNEIPLTAVRPDGTGIDAKVTFLYEVLGTSNAPYLANLSLVGGAEGAYIESPLFLGYEAGKETPVIDGDSFYDIKVNVPVGMGKVIGSGFAGLTGIKALDPTTMTPNELAMSFQVVDKYKPDTGPVDPSQCKQLALFVSGVKPILLASCNGCHGEGSNNNGAKGNLTISASDMVTCQQSKANATDLNNIPATALFIAPKQGASNHPFKLPSSVAWEAAVTTWLTAEKTSP